MATKPYGKAFSDMISLAIQNADKPLLSLLIGPVLDAIHESDANLVKSFSFLDAMKQNDVGVQQLFIDRFGMSDANAYAYIVDCMGTIEPSANMLIKASENLGQFYGPALVKAVMSGKTELAKTIAKSNGYKQVSLTVRNERLHADEHPATPNHKEFSANTKDDFMEILGLKSDWFIYDNLNTYNVFNNLFWHKPGLKKVIDLMNPRQRPVEIPRFKSGKVTYPELAIGFSNASNEFNKVRERIPCWVHKDDINIMESATAFIKEKNVSYKFQELNKHGTVSHKNITLDETQLSDPDFSLSKECFDCKSYFVYVSCGYVLNENGNTPQEERLKSKIDTGIIKSLFTKEEMLGLCQIENYVLAVVNTEELLAYDSDNVSTDRIETAIKYAEDFMPVDVMINCVHLTAGVFIPDSNPACVGIYQADGSTFLQYADDQELANKIVSTISSKEVWLSLLNWVNAKKHYGLIALNEKLELGSKDIPINLSLESAQSLCELNYKFNSGEDDDFRTRLIDDNNILRSSGIEDNKDLIIKFIQLGGWPFESNKPKSIYSAIRKVTRSLYSQADRFFILASDPQIAIKACSTDAQFNKVVEIIGRDVADPFISEMPKKVRANILSNDLGL